MSRHVARFRSPNKIYIRIQNGDAAVSFLYFFSFGRKRGDTSFLGHRRRRVPAKPAYSFQSRIPGRSAVRDLIYTLSSVTPAVTLRSAIPDIPEEL